MSQTQRRPSAVRRSGLAALMLTLCTFLVAAPTAAYAHDELIGSTPSDGEIVEVGPTAIDLRYSANPLEGAGATEVLVVSPSGAEVQQGDPVLDRNGVIQELSGADERGTYTVVWRIVSSDGHPISGELTFSVGETSEPADLPAANDAGGADGETQKNTDAGGVDFTAVWIVIGIVVIGLGGALVAVLMVRARGRNDGV